MARTSRLLLLLALPLALGASPPAPPGQTVVLSAPGRLPGPAPEAAAAVAPRPRAEVLLKDSDHQKMGKLIGECVEAYVAREGRAAAEEDLRDELEKWRKKRGVDGRDPLSLTEDLGRALWHSKDYGRAKGIKKGKVASFEIAIPFYGDEYVQEYALHAPSKYNARDGGYPLLLCIPDAGEKPEAHLTERWVDADLRDSAILVAMPMPSEVAQWGELGSEQNPGGVGVVLSVFGEVSEQYAIDFDRVYLVGGGAGVAAAMRIASMFPDRFAGVLGRSGDAAEIPPDNFRNLPSLFAGAGGRASAFAEAAKAQGIENVTLAAAAGEAELWAWIQDHPRDSNPGKVTLLAGAPFPTKAYWVEIPPHDGQSVARLEAEIDRASNTVTVKAEGIRQVTLFYNDLLVDLEKPVKVVTNGVEHQDEVPRNLNTTLELVYKARNDPGKLYTAFKSYDIPSN